MEGLFARVRAAVDAERVVISAHADEMLRERGIMVWQTIAGVRDGRMLIERPLANPNPVVEVEQLLPDGTPIKAVWALIEAYDVAKLVTVHFFDR